MVKLTMIARVTDGLPLAEGLDDGRDQKDADFYKQQAKLLFKNLSKGQHEASRMSIETGPYYFQYPYVLCGYFILEVTEMSTRLTSDTRIYADKAKDLNRQALIRKYAPVAIVIGVVLMLFWLKNKIW
uniref:Longin domain-containing protein n=1 Tax=Oryza barthii TaxID=65489 RepID=A0A0D3GDU6_9ORYZ